MPEKGFLHKIAIPTADGETITSGMLTAPYILFFNVNNRSYQLAEKTKRVTDERDVSSLLRNYKVDTVFITEEDELEISSCQAVHYPVGISISDALFEFIQELD